MRYQIFQNISRMKILRKRGYFVVPLPKDYKPTPALDGSMRGEEEIPLIPLL